MKNNFVKTILAIMILSVQVRAADFIINFQPAPNSVGDSQISSISTSKISDWVSAFTTLFNSLGGGGGGGVITVAGIESEVSRAGVSTPLSVAPGAAWYDFGLDFTTVIYDPSSLWSVANKEWTIPMSYVGDARGRVTFSFAVNTNGDGYFLLQKNNNPYRYGNFKKGVTLIPFNSTIEFSGVAGDTFRLIFQTGVGTPTFDGSDAMNWAVFKIDPK